MKLFFSLLALSGTLIGLTPALAMVQDAEPVKVPAFYNKIYVPAGFDSNDQVEIVGEGLFRNSCYRPAETSIEVDHDRKIIKVGPAAYEYSGLCLQVVLPFDRVMNVGMLKPGTYEIVQAIDEAKLGKINIAKAQVNGPDDFLYAPISQAFFRQRGLMGEIFITGEFPNSCMQLDEVRISVEKETIVVQPIAKLEDTGDCKSGSFPFSKLVEVKFLKQGRYLLHVRSMNAKSVNALVDMK